MLVQHRALALAAVAPFFIVAACGDKGEVGNIVTPSEPTSANVRFVNATASSTISVANHHVSAPTDSVVLTPGTFTDCLSVDNNSSFFVTNAANGLPYGAFVPGFAIGGSYTAIASTKEDLTTRFLTIVDDFTPPTTLAGAVFFNASPGTGNLVIDGDGSPLDSDAGVGPGTAGLFFSLTPGSHDIAFSTGPNTAIVVEGGTLNFAAAHNTVVILAPSTSVLGGFKVMAVPAC